MGTLVVLVDEVEEVVRVVGCAPGLQNPAYQLCSASKSVAEHNGQTVEGVAARGAKKAD